MLEDFRRESSGKFKNFCRMPVEDFEILLTNNPIKGYKFRKVIPIQERYM